MKKLFSCFLLLITIAFPSFSQIAFSGGNLVVMYIGDGFSPTLTSAAYQEYVAEITPTGGVVQLVTIPTTSAGSRSVESGSATSDADLNTSGDGKLVTFFVFVANTGTASIATAVGINRIVCQINSSGTVSFPASFNSTSIFKTNNVRSVVTNDGTGFWVSGNGSSSSGGIFYIPSGTTNAITTTAGVAKLNTTLLNTRTVKIFKNQLYGNASSGSFKDPYTIGTGLPTVTSQIYTVLTGLPNTEDGYGFVLLDRDGNGVVDLLYIADISGGLLKYYLSGSTWTAAGSLTIAGGLTGLAGYLDCNNNPQLFMTTGSSGPSDNSIYSYNDLTSNSTSLSGTLAANATQILNAGGGFLFRGIAMAPTQGDVSLSSGTITLSGSYRSITITGGTATLSGSSVYASDSIYVGSGATLICGTSFLKGKKFILASGGTLKIGSVKGITASSSLGNIQTSCRSFSTDANYEYNGTAVQVTGDGLPSTVNNLTINNAAGVTLTAAVSAAGLVSFTSGLLTTTSSNLLNIGATGNVTGTSNNSFANGPVRKTGNSPFVFPTGKGNQYAPIAISAPALISDHFTAEYFNSDPGSIYSGSLKDATINHISTCEYWTLERSGGTSNVSATLSWDSPRSCSVTNLSDLIVAHWDVNLATPIWKDLGNGSTTGSITTGTITTSAAVTSFSPFTLASHTSTNPLPIELLDFTAQLNDKNSVDLNWQTSTEINNDFFTVERSDNALHYDQVTQVAGAGNSTELHNYSTTDNSPLNGTSYYRIKQTDYDGKSSYSNSVSINLANASFVNKVYPNPANDHITLSIDPKVTNGFKIEIINSIGEIAYSRIEISEHLFSIDLKKLSQGIYILKATAPGFNYHQNFIKQ